MNLISIRAKFNSTCSETGKSIRKGTTIVFDTVSRKAYHSDSNTAKKLNALDSGSDNVHSHDADLVSAQENAYFDNFCRDNNI